MSDDTYTLEEAKRELAKRDCVLNGHRWQYIETYGKDVPVGLVCDRCGKSVKVVDE